MKESGAVVNASSRGRQAAAVDGHDGAAVAVAEGSWLSGRGLGGRRGRCQEIVDREAKGVEEGVGVR